MANRVTWITGASTGIGAALARKMAGAGDTVAISARSQETLDSVCAENPDRLHPFALDVTDRAAVAAVIEAIETTLGPIDQAVLNAGAYTKTPVDGFSAETVERMMMVNVVGVANALEALMPRMVARRRGAIALMASVAGYRGLPYAAGYSGSKAAVIAMGQSLKAELDGKGVKIQVICPGFVRTPLTDQNEFDMPFLMEPEEAADRIVDGLKGDSFEIAFPKRFALQLKTMQKLPDALFFPMIKKTVGL
ncbi:MAG: SDR family NAD(P)-dependent oxidoreductase [Alphaproteobacteria bacterium]|nr:SDR family NAD(P)-dependent oxidoreductase [Alphaproteobacteria bacterium]